MPPPRPSAASKPVIAPRQPSPPDSDEEDYADEDENDPFADRNALATPKVEGDEPKW